MRKQILFSRARFLTILSAAALLFSMPANAQTCDVSACPAVKAYGDDDAAACRAWATDAVGQHLENEQRSCGEVGEDWHFDIKLHYRICLGLNSLDREQFADGRRKKLEACRTAPKSKPREATKKQNSTKSKTSKKTPEWEEYCRKSYMTDALKVARTAKDWNCTQADPELHLSKQRHYDFCVREAPKGAGDYPLHDLIGDRQEKIKACQQKSATKKPLDRKVVVRRRACSRFADIFLNAKLENDRLKCGNNGDDWHTNWNAHYRSCTDLERGERLRLINGRQSKLRDCRAKVFSKGQLEADDPDVKPELADEGRGGPSDGVRKACNSYAKDAVAHQAANQQLGCGFSGSLWDLNESKHFNACASSRADYAFRSSMSRDAKLRQCTAVRLCKDATRAATLFCQDLTGLIPPKQTTKTPASTPAPKPKPESQSKSEPAKILTGVCKKLKDGVEEWGRLISAESRNTSFIGKHQKAMTWHGQNANETKKIADAGDEDACQVKLNDMPPLPK